MSGHLGVWLLLGAGLFVGCAHASDDLTSDAPAPTTTTRGGARSASTGGRGGSASAGTSSAPVAGGGTGASVTTRAGAGGKLGSAGEGVSEGGSEEMSPGGASSVNVPKELEVDYKAANVDPTDNQIRMGLRIKSAANTAVLLSSLELRYYFTSEVAPPLVIEIYDAAVAHGTTSYHALSHDTLKAEVVLADSYLQLGFTAAAGALNAGDALTLDIAVHGPNWTGNFSEAGDYSFAPDHTDFAAWDHVTLFGGKELLWGKEPP